MHGDLIYILPMLNNRSVKLLTIYIALHIPLHNIFIKMEKYHEFQFCGMITNFIHNILFKLQEYYITTAVIPTPKLVNIGIVVAMCIHLGIENWPDFLDS